MTGLLDRRTGDRGCRTTQTRVWPLVFLVATIALFCASSAGARPLDTASDRTAIRAYHALLRNLISERPSWQTKTDAFIASVSARCPNVAAPLLMLNSANQSAVVAFGQEVGEDLIAARNNADMAAFDQFARTLSRLRWSSSHTQATVADSIKATRALLAFAPSDLCSDTGALVANNAQATPPGTTTWLAAFGRTYSAQQHALNGFLRVLGRFESRSDGRVIDSINHLVDRVAAAEQSLLVAEVPKLLSALGLTS